MSDEPKPAPERSYHIGNVGPGAKVQQGENNSWREGVAGLPDGDLLSQQFATLLDRIAKDASLDKDTRALAQDKAKAVAEGLAKAQESPGILRRALLDAKAWFGNTTSWVHNALSDILKSDAAQKTIGTVTEAATKATIASFVK
jgi:glucuronate isomerase